MITVRDKSIPLISKTVAASPDFKYKTPSSDTSLILDITLEF